MKLCICGDLHLTENKPKSRVDDYVKAQESKVAFIAETTKRYNARFILQPGDFCDKYEIKDKFKTRWIKNLRHLTNIVCVAGQHDLRYHTSDISNTPLGVLEEAIGFTLLHSNNSKPCALSPQTDVYGAGWGRTMPKVINTKKFNILLTHRMIVIDKLWAEQEHYEIAGTFLRRYKDFDLVVSGDNHNSFFYNNKDKWLINCGSLMRSNIDQGDHEPCIWIFDTETKKAEKILIPVEPFKNVVNLKRVEYEKKKNEKLDVLAQSLKKKSRLKGLDYKRRVFERAKSLKKRDLLQPLTEKIIDGVMSDE